MYARGNLIARGGCQAVLQVGHVVAHVTHCAR